MAAARDAADAARREELELARAIQATTIIDTPAEDRTPSATAKLRRAAKGNFVHTDATVMHISHRVVFVMRLKEAMQQYGKEAEKALEAELGSMLEKKVFKFITPGSLTSDQAKKRLPSSYFFKPKFDVDGAFSRLKCRLVAGGPVQHRGDIITNTSITQRHDSSNSSSTRQSNSHDYRHISCVPQCHDEEARSAHVPPT
jgi:hypothetical protein